MVCGGRLVLDPGGHGGFPGSGSGRDGGTGQLWLVRIDRGTANLSDSIQTLVERTTAALAGAGLSPRGVAIVSLYDGAVLWATSDVRFGPPTAISGVLRARAALDNPAPAGCPAATLLDVGRQLSSLSSGASAPFGLRPGALLVGVVDHGARPESLAGCGDPSPALADDPACWANFFGVALHSSHFRFALFSTPETGTTAAMQTACLGVSGFPVQTLDALEASPNAYYDPLSDGINQRQPGLATQFDLCRAFGSGGPSQLAAFASAWAQVLVGQP